MRYISRFLKSKYAAVAVLAAIYLFFVLIGPPGFSGFRNFEMISRQTAIVGTIALGMTLVIILGGIDLSVGSILAFATVLAAWLLQSGVPALLSAVLTVAAAGFIGSLNGFIITRFKIMPFIVTLGSLLIIRGLAKGLSGEQKIDAPESRLNELLAAPAPEMQWMIVSPGVWLTLFLALLTGGILRYTRIGRYIYAIGSSEKTAVLCGVPVTRVKVIVYALSGVFAGIGGVLQFSRLTVGDPTVGSGVELDVIAAVVIGGGSLSGGEGSVFGTLVGALIMSVIRAGCSQTGMPNWIQEIVTGVIIITAVCADRLRHSR